MTGVVSTVVSVVALGVSLFTLWFTVLRRGTVRSTHPSFIAFRYDFVESMPPQAKVFFRSLLYSTSKRGHVVECLVLRVSEGERSAEFSFWGHGDRELVRGSGLFVPETGVATNHHFNPTDAGDVFVFSGGKYSIALVANVVGLTRPVSLWAIEVEIPAGVFGVTIARATAIYFSWSPERGHYVASIEKRSGSVHAFSDPSDPG